MFYLLHTYNNLNCFEYQTSPKKVRQYNLVTLDLHPHFNLYDFVTGFIATRFIKMIQNTALMIFVELLVQNPSQRYVK